MRSHGEGKHIEYDATASCLVRGLCNRRGAASGLCRMGVIAECVSALASTSGGAVASCRRKPRSASICEGFADHIFYNALMRFV